MSDHIEEIRRLLAAPEFTWLSRGNALALLSALDRVIQERDFARDELDRLQTDLDSLWEKRAEAAEQRVEELIEGWNKIADDIKALASGSPEDCPALSPKGEKCKFKAGHDSTGEPHSWTQMRLGGSGSPEGGGG